MKARTPRKRPASGAGAGRVHFQRCAVRVMYAQNSTRGQWRAHGRYIARESARSAHSREPGFDERGHNRDIAARLGEWQSAGDLRLWKIIISPEFGDRVELERLTRDLMQRMEQDLGTRLEWVAVAHFNTDNPHVHVALRGVRDNGQPLTLGRDYIKLGIRNLAADLCTRQLGYRSQADMVEAQRREVRQERFTSLDRAIARDDPGVAGAEDFAVRRDPAEPRDRFVIARLRTLQGMGLAEPVTDKEWQVRRDFATALRARQRAADRLKTFASHGVTVSDERLPLVVTPIRGIDTLDGRVLSHGEDEATGRMFMLLEGTDARVHWLNHTDEITASRARRGLRANSFVRLRKLFIDGRPLLEIDELGQSAQVLHDRAILRATALDLMRRGVVPQENGWNGWNGWLGRYQAALQNEIKGLESQSRIVGQVRRARRELSRGRGR